MNVIAEYEFVKRILYIEIPVLITLNVLVYLLYLLVPSTFFYNYLLIPDFLLYDALLSPAQNMLLFSVTAGLIWFFYQSRRREFKYYLAKTYIKKISENRGEAEQIRYLIHGLNSYNKYLLRNLKLQINDIKKIYSKILSDSNNDINDSIKKISDSFKHDNKLSPIKTLAIIANKEPDQFLAKESAGEKLRTWGSFAATVIPVALSILAAILSLIFPKFVLQK